MQQKTFNGPAGGPRYKVKYFRTRERPILRVEISNNLLWRMMLGRGDTPSWSGGADQDQERMMKMLHGGRKMVNIPFVCFFFGT